MKTDEIAETVSCLSSPISYQFHVRSVQQKETDAQMIFINSSLIVNKYSYLMIMTVVILSM
jgi:hypothetical protein